MRKKDVINFAPTGVNRRKKTPKYVALIVLLCIAALAASVFIILAMNDFDISKALGARQPEVTSETLADTASSGVNSAESDMPDVRSEYAFLVLCTDKSELMFSQLIYVEPAAARIKICPVSENRILKTENGEITLAEAVRSTSLNSVCEAFAADNIKIDRYVHVTEENYRILLSNLGVVNVEIEEDCEFNVDAVKYTFSKGTQGMTSDMLIKYLRYAGDESSAAHIRATVTASVFRQHFTKSNFEKGESFFSSLINSVDSNITAFDYDAAKPVLEDMLSAPFEITVVD